MLSGATTINARLSPRTGLVDVHTHAIDEDLPDLRAACPHDLWPSVEHTGETEARLSCASPAC
jgi:aminocarboxymuconate-semialdehyde decarboxylase